MTKLPNELVDILKECKESLFRLQWRGTLTLDISYYDVKDPSKTYLSYCKNTL